MTDFLCLERLGEGGKKQVEFLLYLHAEKNFDLESCLSVLKAQKESSQNRSTPVYSMVLTPRKSSVLRGCAGSLREGSAIGDKIAERKHSSSEK